MQELILRSDVEKMLETKLEGIGNRDYGDQSERILGELLYELSQLESKYEAVAYTPEYILANRIWKSIDTPPHTEWQYLVIDEYVPWQQTIGIWYYSPLWWDRKSYTHWMALPTIPNS